MDRRVVEHPVEHLGDEICPPVPRCPPPVEQRDNGLDVLHRAVEVGENLIGVCVDVRGDPVRWASEAEPKREGDRPVNWAATAPPGSPVAIAISARQSSRSWNAVT